MSSVSGECSVCGELSVRGSISSEFVVSFSYGERLW